MASGWKRTMEFLGLVETYDEVDELDEADDDLWEPDHRARSEGASVRRLSPAAANGPGGEERDLGQRDSRRRSGSPVRPVPSATVHVTTPTTFNDVEEVGERFRSGIPVIMNLAEANETVAKRVLDFASGLIFGLEGRIERVGERVFVLTPVGTEVSTEERRRLSERGFFNQE